MGLTRKLFTTRVNQKTSIKSPCLNKSNKSNHTEWKRTFFSKNETRREENFLQLCYLRTEDQHENEEPTMRMNPAERKPIGIGVRALEHAPVRFRWELSACFRRAEFVWTFQSLSFSYKMRFKNPQILIKFLATLNAIEVLLDFEG